jgi:hypothetical protein
MQDDSGACAQLTLPWPKNDGWATGKQVEGKHRLRSGHIISSEYKSAVVQVHGEGTGGPGCRGPPLVTYKFPDGPK